MATAPDIDGGDTIEETIAAATLQARRDAVIELMDVISGNMGRLASEVREHVALLEEILTADIPMTPAALRARITTEFGRLLEPDGQAAVSPDEPPAGLPGRRCGASAARAGSGGRGRRPGNVAN
jgi:PTS system fructose IIA component